MLVRDAVPGDAAAVAAVYVESWNRGFTGLAPRRELTPGLVRRWEHDLGAGLPWRWWAAADAGDLVGFAGIGPSRDPVAMGLGELDTIAVRPSWWRRGVGRALMAVAVRQLGADGYLSAVLWTFAGYPRGAAFYRATGWVPDGGARADGTQVRYRRWFRSPAGEARSRRRGATTCRVAVYPSCS